MLLSRKRFLVIASMIFYLFVYESALAKLKPGQPAPGFTLTSATGKNIRLKELRGKVVMVNFWATWCGPCRQEMPILNDIYRKYRKSGFVLLGINIDDDRSVALKMAKKLRVSFPILFDTEKKVSDLYKVSGMPFTVIIDQDGNVRHIHKGYVPGVEKKYYSEIRKLLTSY